MQKYRYLFIGDYSPKDTQVVIDKARANGVRAEISRCHNGDTVMWRVPIEDVEKLPQDGPGPHFYGWSLYDYSENATKLWERSRVEWRGTEWEVI